MTKKDIVTIKAKEILASSPDGIRWADLIRRLRESFPNYAEGVITGNTFNLPTRFPDEIYKPVRGLFRLTKFKRDEDSVVKVSPVSESPQEIGKIREESFYQPFAEWLVKGVEECTAAIPLGGNRFKEKWGTPDVFGVFKCGEFDVFKLPMKIVVAEIKTDTNQLITAFGQACAYRLFADKSYLVIPKKSQPEDIDRLDSLCIIFGIGFILFDATSPAKPDFEIRVRATGHEPDTFYANEYLKLVAHDLHLL
jgi:hypothetical protein